MDTATPINVHYANTLLVWPENVSNDQRLDFTLADTRDPSYFNVERLRFYFTDDEVNVACLMRMLQEWALMSRNSSEFSNK
jgi:hypothetical protein